MPHYVLSSMSAPGSFGALKEAMEAASPAGLAGLAIAFKTLDGRMVTGFYGSNTKIKEELLGALEVLKCHETMEIVSTALVWPAGD